MNILKTPMIAVLAIAACIAGELMAQAAPKESEEPWQLQGTAAELYESTLVPAVFDPWAADLIERVSLRSEERVLDVATGTGIVARRAKRLMGPSGNVVGLDLNSSMLDIARTRTDGAGIDWVRGDAQDLPYDADSFDVVFIQQGLQFFPDRVQAVRELYRVLKPCGRFGVSIWLGADHNPYGKALAEALDRHIDPEVGAGMRAPFVDHAARDMETWLRAEGFSEVRIDVVRRDMHVASPSNFVRRHMAALPFTARIVERGNIVREAVVQDVLDALSAYETDMGWSVPWASAVAVGRK